MGNKVTRGEHHELENAMAYELFSKYASSDTMSEGDFTKFLANMQREPDLTPEEVTEIFTRAKKAAARGEQIKQVDRHHDPHIREKIRPINSTKNGMDLTEFIAYLRSIHLNCAFNARERCFIQNDMNQPLTHYFVASSHNTYLPEGQILSYADVDMYRKALLRGCRCVELDCWDGDSGQPIVTHGGAGVQPVMFVDCMRCINEYAFAVSEFPVILSLEMHCTEVQQIEIARILRECLGDKLFTIAHIRSLGDDDRMRSELTPMNLRRKVLVKNRLSHSGNEDLFSISKNATQVTSKLANNVMAPNNRVTTTHRAERLGSDLDSCVFMQGVELKAFFSFQETGKIYQVVSMSEGKAAKLSRQHNAEFLHITEKMFVRTFPAGYRLKSHNFNPLNSWRSGAQLAALNYQTNDFPVRINDGFFSQNGSCGWVLKPAPFLYQHSQCEKRSRTTGLNVAGQPDPSLGDSATEHAGILHRYPTVTHSVEITVLNAYSLKDNLDMLTAIDPVIKVGISGILPDENWWETSSVRNNALNPWWGEKVTFPIRAFDFDVIHFRVSDHDVRPFAHGECVGDVTIPLTCLNEGIRAIPVRDNHGTCRGSNGDVSVIMCHIRIVHHDTIAGGGSGASGHAFGGMTMAHHKNSLNSKLKNSTSTGGQSPGPQTQCRRNSRAMNIKSRRLTASVDSFAAMGWSHSKPSRGATLYKYTTARKLPLPLLEDHHHDDDQTYIFVAGDCSFGQYSQPNFPSPLVGLVYDQPMLLAGCYLAPVQSHEALVQASISHQTSVPNKKYGRQPRHHTYQPQYQYQVEPNEQQFQHSNQQPETALTPWKHRSKPVSILHRRFK